jgi:integrase
VRNLKSENSGIRLVIYDAKARGLCLRVTPSTKSWSFVYRPKGSLKQRRYTIGDYPAWSLSQARDKALALRHAVQDGGDPVTERKSRREVLTLAALAERFIAKHAKPRLRTWQKYEALLRSHVLPVLGERPAEAVTRAEVANLLDKVAERAPIAANRTQNTLSSLYAWAISEGLAAVNPIQGLRPRAEEVVKDRVLTDDELRSFWTGTESIPVGYRDAFRLILLTGQRPGECAGISADELDDARRLWTIPASRSKNKRAHVVPLVGRAHEIIAQLADGKRKGALLTTPRGGEPSVVDLAKAFERLRSGGLFQSPVTAHDLRRTAATLMARLEIDRLTIAYVLNHASLTKRTVTGSTYDRHDYLPQMRRALEALDAEVARIVSGVAMPENVVPMTRARS